MKKLLLVVSLFLTIYLMFNILKIVMYDFDRLTDYGFGYLTGKVVFLFLFGTLSFFVGRNIYLSPKK